MKRKYQSADSKATKSDWRGLNDEVMKIYKTLPKIKEAVNKEAVNKEAPNDLTVKYQQAIADLKSQANILMLQTGFSSEVPFYEVKKRVSAFKTKFDELLKNLYGEFDVSPESNFSCSFSSMEIAALSSINGGCFAGKARIHTPIFDEHELKIIKTTLKNRPETPQDAPPRITTVPVLNNLLKINPDGTIKNLIFPPSPAKKQKNKS